MSRYCRECGSVLNTGEGGLGLVCRGGKCPAQGVETVCGCIQCDAKRAEIDRLKKKLAVAESIWVKVLQIIESERNWLQLVEPPEERDQP